MSERDRFGWVWFAVFWAGFWAFCILKILIQAEVLG